MLRALPQALTLYRELRCVDVCHKYRVSVLYDVSFGRHRVLRVPGPTPQACLLPAPSSVQLATSALRGPRRRHLYPVDRLPCTVCRVCGRRLPCRLGSTPGAVLPTAPRAWVSHRALPLAAIMEA